MNVVALYTDPRGPYPQLCESWDATRDARLYAGPAPVVAHPPCGPYSKQRHNYKGAEHDCAPRALEQVRAFGGVLEHPAGSTFWDKAGLPKPYPQGVPGEGMCYSETDAHGGFTIQVDQSDWGHVARKPTWVYIVGADWLAVARMYDARPFPGRPPTHWCSGSRTNKGGGSVPAGIKVCSAQQRRKTPPAFAQFLIDIASHAGAPTQTETPAAESTDAR